MSQGLFAAVSGIRANQTWLNVISNNIANINTSGFKGSGVVFANVFSNTITAGTPPNGTLGGTNPRQIGNGVQVADIPTNFSQGSTQFTGRSTDSLINGEGFYAVERVDQNLGTSASAYYLTRAGSFSLDSNGNLVTSAGNRARGTSQVSGSDPNAVATVKIPQEFLIVKEIDTTGKIVNVSYGPLGSTVPAPGAGNTQNIAQVKLNNFSIGRDGGIVATYSNGDRILVRTDVSTINPVDPTQARRQIIHLPAEGGTYAAINQVASDSGPVTQFAGPGGANDLVFLNGANTAGPPNPLQGMQMQIQTATVTNPAGLVYDSNSNFLVSANSGNTYLGIPGSENRGTLQAGSLEGSNVDVAGEFTNMIVAQRGLDASSKVIRTQSEVLQTIINIVQ